MDIHLERLTLGRMQHPVRGFLHGSAAVLAIVGSVLLWVRGSGVLSHQVALLIFGLSLIALFTVSSLYHSYPWHLKWKKRMQRLDHSMIYLVIAGTYTPILWIVFDGWVRWASLAVVWGIAAIGITQKAFMPGVRNWFSISLQMMQGWIAILLFPMMFARLPFSAVAFTVLGGLLYSVGMVFVVTKRPRLWPRVFSYHEVFHILVIAGSAAHFTVAYLWLARLGVA
jgi:hemolysin III